MGETTVADILRAAAAQVDVVPFDVDANLERHLARIEEARGQGAELLLFPELSLTGYDVGARGYEIAMTHDDPRLAQLAEAAGDVTVIVGFVEEGYAAQFFNSAAVMSGGEVVFVHRKLNLATYGMLEEAKFFASGRYVEPFALKPPFTGSLLICADMWNPALVHLAALHGSTLLLAPTNSAQDSVSGAFSNPAGWDLVLRFSAMIYGLPIIMANRVGSEGDLHFWGGSRIIGPHGDDLASAGLEGEKLIVADIDYGDVRRARFELPTVRDSNLGLVHREINRLAERVGVPESLRRRRS